MNNADSKEIVEVKVSPREEGKESVEEKASSKQENNEPDKVKDSPRDETEVLSDKVKNLSEN